MSKKKDVVRDEHGDVIHGLRTNDTCVYCKRAPREDGRACHQCKNYPERRYQFDPIRGMYKKFLGV